MRRRRRRKSRQRGRKSRRKMRKSIARRRRRKRRKSMGRTRKIITRRRRKSRKRRRRRRKRGIKRSPVLEVGEDDRPPPLRQRFILPDLPLNLKTIDNKFSFLDFSYLYGHYKYVPQ